MIGLFNVDRCPELTVLQMYIDIKEGDVGGGDVPGEMDCMVSIEVLKEGLKGILTMGPDEEDVIYKPQPKAGFI